MTWLGFFTVLFTIILIVDCLFLILLVLVQLPKKEAGLGQAFGGGATDALFGAGSGNALTKMTKYATGVFFVLTLSLSIMYAQQAKGRRSGLEKAVEKATQTESALPGQPTATQAPATTTPAASATAPLTVNTNLLSAPAANTNAPAATQPATNPVPEKAK